ncbi:MAG: hypothetical protein KatS3mg023_2663 [Armatimonadota bacterium]|nr:MAG: hypothetical protein KatS3mg023_2663 [Armatimonadota bacterium]
MNRQISPVWLVVAIAVIAVGFLVLFLRSGVTPPKTSESKLRSHYPAPKVPPLEAPPR